MSVITPSPPSYHIENTNTSLRVIQTSIRGKRYFIGSIIYAIIVLSILWIFLLWLFIQVSEMLSEIPTILYFMVGLLVLGSIGIIFVALGRYTSREVIEITSTHIDIHRSNIFHKRTKRYLTEHIKGVYVISQFYNPNPIAVDYSTQTIRFGLGLDEAEARSIVKTIQKRFPQFTENIPSNSG